jgi:hypothetical protein
MQPGFDFSGKTDIWQLLAWNPAGHVRSAHFMESVGRRAPGTTLAQAEEALATLTARLEKEFPRTTAIGAPASFFSSRRLSATSGPPFWCFSERSRFSSLSLAPTWRTSCWLGPPPGRKKSPSAPRSALAEAVWFGSS